MTMNQPNYKENIYIGTAKTNFKHRFNNGTKSFKLEHYKNDTELSKEYGTIKRNHFISKINWRIPQQKKFWREEVLVVRSIRQIRNNLVEFILVDREKKIIFEAN